MLDGTYLALAALLVAATAAFVALCRWVEPR